jgi:hypothetical protein
MQLPVETEANIEKVLEWFEEDHSRYPAVGSQAIVVSHELNVLPGEVTLANRRVALGLKTLKTIKKSSKASVVIKDINKEK